MTSKAIFLKRSMLASALILSQSIYLVPLGALAADGDVRLAGQALFTVPSEGSLSATQRAQTVQQNLDNALVAAKDRTPAAVNITYVKGVPVLTVGGYQVVTVDSASAKALKMSPALLAKKWGDALRSSLTDQASVLSYVAQISGNYASSAPAAQNNAPAQAQAPVQTSYQPEQNSQPPTQTSWVPNQNSQPQAQQNYQAQSQQNYQPQGQQNYQPPANYGTQSTYPTQGQQGAPFGQGQPYRQGRVAYAPAGMTMNISLSTGISTTVAKAGDTIQAALSQPLVLGDSTIPAGSTLEGTVTDANAGKMLGRSGSLGIKFNRIRTPDGQETPISAHLVGGIGKYANNGKDEVHGETWKTKVGQGAIRTGVGAGAGAALGTAVGAIAGGMSHIPGAAGFGAGQGAWAGTAIGGTVGLADSVLLRKGKDVNIPAGTAMELQLDQAISFTGPANTASSGQGPYGY
jgi:hypothetical protein